MKTRLPKKGDMFFTGFESDYPGNPDEVIKVEEVEGRIDDGNGNIGRSITASDGIGYDCFWSKKHQIFVYALE